jgi:hypothetical protein
VWTWTQNHKDGGKNSAAPRFPNLLVESSGGLDNSTAMPLEEEQAADSNSNMRSAGRDTPARKRTTDFHVAYTLYIRNNLCRKLNIISERPHYITGLHTFEKSLYKVMSPQILSYWVNKMVQRLWSCYDYRSRESL